MNRIFILALMTFLLNGDPQPLNLTPNPVTIGYGLQNLTPVYLGNTNGMDNLHFRVNNGEFCNLSSGIRSPEYYWLSMYPEPPSPFSFEFCGWHFGHEHEASCTVVNYDPNHVYDGDLEIENGDMTVSISPNCFTFNYLYLPMVATP